MIGRAIAKALIGLGTMLALTYVNYRLNGGPPIREVYKEVKREREHHEDEAFKANGGRIYVDNCVVR